MVRFFDAMKVMALSVAILVVFLIGCSDAPETKISSSTCSQDLDCIDPCNGMRPQMCVNSRWAEVNFADVCEPIAVEWKGDCSCIEGSCGWKIDCLKLQGEYRDRCIGCSKDIALTDPEQMRKCILN